MPTENPLGATAMIALQTPNRPALNPDSDLLEAGGSLMPDFSALICKKRVAPGQLPIIIIASSG
jgi:hypothetical protein